MHTCVCSELGGGGGGGLRGEAERGGGGRGAKRKLQFLPALANSPCAADMQLAPWRTPLPSLPHLLIDGRHVLFDHGLQVLDVVDENVCVVLHALSRLARARATRHETRAHPGHVTSKRQAFSPRVASALRAAWAPAPPAKHTTRTHTHTHATSGCKPGRMHVKPAPHMQRFGGIVLVDVQDTYVKLLRGVAATDGPVPGSVPVARPRACTEGDGVLASLPPKPRRIPRQSKRPGRQRPWPPSVLCKVCSLEPQPSSSSPRQRACASFHAAAVVLGGLWCSGSGLRGRLVVGKEV